MGWRRIAADCDGDARVAKDIGVFLRIARHNTVQQEAVVDIAHHGRLRPAIQPVCRDRHDSMLVEQPNDQAL
jgi:hypothetical protein